MPKVNLALTSGLWLAHNHAGLTQNPMRRPRGMYTCGRHSFGTIDSPWECERNNPDSLDARLFPSVVLAVAPAVTMDEASSPSGVRVDEDHMITPERHLPTPGQNEHSPRRHTAAGTTAPRPHHHRHGEHSPTARQPHSNGLCSTGLGGGRSEVSA